ncbi:hypothetical protein BDP55DRAFT_708191 [Colletotrichum godetiae]|uniref:NAD(P)-binding domain-containing protein n=1 Tax=Colletotrichum godetiae TaxID=1209918 RepID=A0AAJ0ERE9_9PEZI|nr:uncharacterized protein BDP55DRAFT_708191 [Colletotrichum godetiae]KAK1658428.1 hypothetical protein BDP55DRAFT_708191 [Colletotrichum godetiae]
MLVLVAGVSGNIGQKLVDALHARGHQVRGLGRNPAKLTATRRAKLEDFILTNKHYDIEALDRACKGTEAVICAYGVFPTELQFDRQLFLLRAAERTNIRRFVLSTYPFIAFRRIAELSSPINPIYIFTGVLAEVFWVYPDHSPGDVELNGYWDGRDKSASFWGNGDKPMPWSTERDAADFTAAIISRDNTEEGGCWNTVSGIHSVRDLPTVYQRVKGKEVSFKIRGTDEDLKSITFEARKSATPRDFFQYMSYFYQFYTNNGIWDMAKIDNDKLDVRATSPEDFFFF